MKNKYYKHSNKQVYLKVYYLPPIFWKMTSMLYYYTSDFAFWKTSVLEKKIFWHFIFFLFFFFFNFYFSPFTWRLRFFKDSSCLIFFFEKFEKIFFFKFLFLPFTLSFFLNFDFRAKRKYFSKLLFYDFLIPTGSKFSSFLLYL